MTSKEAIKWLRLQETLPIAWDDYSEETKEIREEAEKHIKEAFGWAIKALEAYRAHQEFMDYMKNNPVGGYKGDNHNW